MPGASARCSGDRPARARLSTSGKAAGEPSKEIQSDEPDGMEINSSEMLVRCRSKRSNLTMYWKIQGFLREVECVVSNGPATRVVTCTGSVMRMTIGYRVRSRREYDMIDISSKVYRGY